MSQNVLNPAALHDPRPLGYSHSVGLPAGRDLVFISGQFGSQHDGQVVSASFADQVERAFDNLTTVLRAHGLEPEHVVQLRTYIVGMDFDKLGLLGQAVGRIWADAPPANTVLGVAALATPDIHFEVEAVAAHP